MGHKHNYRTFVGDGNGGFYLNEDHSAVREQIELAIRKGDVFTTFTNAVTPDGDNFTVHIAPGGIKSVMDTSQGPDPSAPRGMPVSLEQVLSGGVAQAG